MKTFYVELGTQSTSVQAINEFAAAKNAIIEFMPEDSKATEKRFQESDEFPLSLEDLKQDYKDSDMNLIVKEVNNKFTDVKGDLNMIQRHNLENLNGEDLAFILNNQVSCVIETNRTITNTVDIDGGIEFQVSSTLLSTNVDAINRVLAVASTGNVDLKSTFTTFQFLVFAKGGSIYLKNSNDNLVDCTVRVNFWKN